MIPFRFPFYDTKKCRPVGTVAVGMLVAQHPPHRSGLEELPNPASAIGNNAKAHYLGRRPRDNHAHLEVFLHG